MSEREGDGLTNNEIPGKCSRNFSDSLHPVTIPGQYMEFAEFLVDYLDPELWLFSIELTISNSVLLFTGNSLISIF